MRNWKRVSRLLWASPFALGTILFISPVQAQQDNADEADEVEEITVTGSRIRRDEFSSPAPIQVLDVDAGRKLGLSSISDMIQQASVSSGEQLDASINTGATNFNATEAPPIGGVGSTNVNLRGLGPERTLILVNGRRLGSTGVRGAPAQPDISLIPFSMVERVEILTEGVSAVYGADAVSGVVNVILRDEFEGFEILANTEQPQHEGGEVGQIGMIAGVVGDRGSFQFAAEAYNRKRVRTGDRGFARCFRDIDVREDGSVESICRSGFFDNNGFDENFNVILYTPGATNIGVPNWSDSTVGDVLPWNPTNPLVADPGPGGRWPYFDFYNDQDERRNADLVGELETFSLVSSGKLSLDWWSNEELFFETMFMNNRVFSKAGTEQIFPDILGRIPQLGANGNVIVDGTGAPILVDNPLNPFPGDFTPILTLDSIPQTRDVERTQARLVLGLRGDLGNSSWGYEFFGSYDRGIGFQAQPILFEPNLDLSLHNIALDTVTGEVTCNLRGNTSTIAFGFITADNCVPLDFNRPELFTGGPNGEGVFSAAEQDFLVGNRTNRTVVEQEMLGLNATGDLFEVAGRTISAAFGAEFRKDTIASQNDIVGVKALNAAESPLQEGETIGSRHIFEVYGEFYVPIFETLNFDGAVRYTDESNFGTETTWRARAAWTPVDWFTLSGTHGTSFRAPNLREQFLANQFGGIGGSADPCIFANINQLVTDSGDQDPQTQLVIQNCMNSGVIFTDSDNNGFLDTTQLGASGVTTIPVATGGNASLKAETSKTNTVTVKLSQPWTEAVDVDLAVSFFDITINNTVAEPEASFIIDGCFADPQFAPGTSPFCSLLTRSGGNAQSNFINFVDVSFINIGEETARGIDINSRVSFELFDSLDVSWSTVTTKLIDRQIETFDPSDRNEHVGEIGFNKWKFASTLGVNYGDWEFRMHQRLLGATQQDNPDPLNPGAGRFSADGIGSRDLDFTGRTWYTDFSATYGSDQWAATLGVRNAFDEDPPLIHSFEGPNRNNAVSAAGYDFFGRTWFINTTLSF